MPLPYSESSIVFAGEWIAPRLTVPLTGPLPHMIDMDDPQHHLRRSLVSKGFTPRRIAALEPQVTAIVTGLLDGFQGGDFISEVAALIPLYVIADLLGIPAQDRRQLLTWSEDMLAGQGDRSEATLQRTLPVWKFGPR